MIELNVFTVLSQKAERNIKRAAKLLLAVMGVKKYRERLRMKTSDFYREATERREKIYQEFYGEYIGAKVHSNYRESIKRGKSLYKEYDCVIAGSDQIWNKNIIKTDEALRFYYLPFIERTKRMNYAPSFGDREIPPEEYPIHREGLDGFDVLSCREKSGCDFIRKLTGREAELVLDPTFLLTAEQWRRISRKPEYRVPDHYVLRYCWEPDSWADEQREIAGGRKIIDVLDPQQKYRGGTGPCEFVWLVDHADFVFSESFHGTAFSLNMGKNFLSFMKTRKDKGRIGSLLSETGLSGHIYEPEMCEIPDDIDYSAVREKLGTMREKSLKYLRECLKV